MLRLRGKILATVDNKGQLKLPAVFKVGVESSYNKKTEFFCGYHLAFFDDLSTRCLYLMIIWGSIEANLSVISGTNNAKRRSLEVTACYGLEVDIDSKDRFLILQVLRGSAQLKDEVVILGQIDYLDICKYNLFNQRIAADSLDADYLAILAEFGI